MPKILFLVNMPQSQYLLAQHMFPHVCEVKCCSYWYLQLLDLHTIYNTARWLPMMLFADSVTMPSLKISSKRKAQLNNGDHLPPPSKKAALQHAEVPPLLGGGGSPKEVPSLLDSRKKTKKLILPNGVHVTKISGDNFSYNPILGKRKASRDAEVALHLLYRDLGNVAKTKESDGQEYTNGHSSTANVSNGSVLYVTGKSNASNTDSLQHQDKTEPLLRSFSAKHIEKLSPRPTSSDDPQPSPSEVNTESKKKPVYPSLKLPSLVIPNCKRNSKKGDVIRNTVSTGNYIRRVASLNASACVTALMEPERKSFSKAIRNPEVCLKAVPTCTPTSPTGSKTSSIYSKDKQVTKKRSQSPYSCSSTCSSEAESLSSYCSSSELDMTEPHVYRTLLVLASMADESHCEDDISYNRYGLLYNGDTVFPSARVFYNSDTDLSLPHRIIPKVLPSHEKYARAAADQVLRFKSIGKKKKAAKVRLCPSLLM